MASCLHLPSPGSVLLYPAFYVDPGNRTMVRLTGLTLLPAETSTQMKVRTFNVFKLLSLETSHEIKATIISVSPPVFCQLRVGVGPTPQGP